MSIILALLSYIYNPSDWQHYPDFADIRNFTSDAFNTVYVVTTNSILELDDDSNLPKKAYTPGQRLPTPINLAIYDYDTRYFWIATDEGSIYSYSVMGAPPKRIPLSASSHVHSIGLDEQYVYIDYGSSVASIDKYTQIAETAQPGSDTRWVSSVNTDNRAYPFIAPWYINDIEIYPFKQVYVHRNKAYVSAPGYGYLVYSTQGWWELTRFRGPKTQGLHSLFTSDSSLYAVGITGVSELPKGQGTFIFHPFDRWGTTEYKTPAWSKGAYSKLRRIDYHRFRLINNHLFLLENRDAHVLNIPSGTLSDIITNRWIYDVDYSKDTLFFATDEGAFITIPPEDISTPLADERTNLVAEDVYGIIRGIHARYFWTDRMIIKQSPQGWDYYTHPSYLPIPQEAIAGRDSLIVSGGEGGLVIYNPETFFEQRLTTEEGLLSDNVTALFIEDNYLWIATDAGLSRFDLTAVLP